MATEHSSTDYQELLHKGIRTFYDEVYSADPERYRKVADHQNPHTLVITCADSRIDPEAITQSAPGQIFVTRNIGNLVPPYGEMLGGVSAVIEFAVLKLEVKQIVVCGHSDCGAMKGLLNRPALKAMPTVDRWLTNGDSALSIVKAKLGTLEGENTLRELTRENVLLQLSHLATHPSVAGRLAEGKLKLFGWVYDIGEGKVEEYNADTKQFKTIV